MVAVHRYRLGDVWPVAVAADVGHMAVDARVAGHGRCTIVRRKAVVGGPVVLRHVRVGTVVGEGDSPGVGERGERAEGDAEDCIAPRRHGKDGVRRFQR